MSKYAMFPLGLTAAADRMLQVCTMLPKTADEPKMRYTWEACQQKLANDCWNIPKLKMSHACW